VIVQHEFTHITGRVRQQHGFTERFLRDRLATSGFLRFCDMNRDSGAHRL